MPPHITNRSGHAATAARPVLAACAIALSVSVAACGGGAGEPGTGGQVFIASSRDFDGFKTWTSFDLGTDQTDGIPVEGARRAYLNKLPATGSTSFPVGTIIVKTIGEELPTPGQTFAMSKRGAPFNMLGATGWEWFELVEGTAAVPAIKWRGIAPPAGETYAGIMGGACNTCHALGSANDFVPSAELSLDQF